MNKVGDWSVLLAMVLAVGVSSPVTGAEDRPAIDARADRVLRAMSDYLQAAEQFTFRADVAYDVVTVHGQMLQYGGTGEIAVRRPDHFRVEHRGDEKNLRVVFNGEMFTFHNIQANLYAQKEMKTDIDTAVDRMFDRFGFSVPTADLVYSNPYATLTGSVDDGFHVGMHIVDGVTCHHLSYSQESIDWQIWIEDGPRPLPRKLLITYKDEPGSPQYAVHLSRWNLDPRISDAYFEFVPPVGAGLMEFLPDEPGEAAP
jgi:hypothetical protein